VDYSSSCLKPPVDRHRLENPCESQPRRSEHHSCRGIWRSNIARSNCASGSYPACSSSSSAFCSTRSCKTLRKPTPKCLSTTLSARSMRPRQIRELQLRHRPLPDLRVPRQGTAPWCALAEGFALKRSTTVCIASAIQRAAFGVNTIAQTLLLVRSTRRGRQSIRTIIRAHFTQADGLSRRARNEARALW
jgi:hypothetical protein